MMERIDQSTAFEVALQRNRLYGAYPAQVTDIKDPEGQGRVQIKLPWSPDSRGGYKVWARLAAFMAGNNRGSWFIPDPDDEVLVIFEGGDPRLPYVIGALWNGRDAPPEQMDGSGNNYKKTIRSRKGVKITIDDTDGAESITLQTPGGQIVTVKDGPGSIELQDSTGNHVKLEAAGITLQTSATLTIQASMIDITACSVNVNAGSSTFSGIAQANAFITPSVVGSSYTPGAGNIW